MKVAVDSDANGTELKKHVLAVLLELGEGAVDLAGDTMDYCDVARRAARTVSDGVYDRAVLVCGTGLGVAIAANKVQGVRAGTCHDEYSAERLVLSNSANVLCLGSLVANKGQAERVVRAWVAAERKLQPATERGRKLAEEPSETLLGRRAVVTGASSGVGAAVAVELARRGASVCAGYNTDEPGADRTLDAVARYWGRRCAVAADVRNPGEVRSMFKAARDALGGWPDVLVNCAGVYQDAVLSEVAHHQFQHQMEVNTWGPLLCTRVFATEAAAGSCVVNVGSLVSSACPPGLAVYSASKAALDSLTRTLAAELGPRGVRVNSVNPGPVDTEGARKAGKAGAYEELKKRTPLGRTGTVEDVARVVAFLCSRDAQWVTGQCLGCDGGLRG